MERAFPRSPHKHSSCALSLLIFAVVAVEPCYGAPQKANATTHTIVIEAMKFSPETLEIKAGDTVVWVNKDPFPHNATAADQSFRSKDIAPDGSWSFKPRGKGEFLYICTLHPTMKAHLTVK